LLCRVSGFVLAKHASGSARLLLGKELAGASALQLRSPFAAEANQPENVGTKCSETERENQAQPSGAPHLSLSLSFSSPSARWQPHSSLGQPPPSGADSATAAGRPVWPLFELKAAGSSWRKMDKLWPHNGRLESARFPGQTLALGRVIILRAGTMEATEGDSAGL